MTGTANAIVMGLRPIPDRSPLKNGMRIDVTIIEDYTEIDDEYHVYVCCDSYTSPETGVKVTFTKTDDNEWEVSIPTGGDPVVAVQGKLPGDTKIYVCADHLTGMVKAGLLESLQEPAWADDVDPGDGRYYGLGHNNVSHQNRFDDFKVTEMRRPGEVCNDCWCWCLQMAPKKSLVAEIFDATDRAACLGEVTWDMDWTWNAGTPWWEGTAKYPKKTSGQFEDVAFRLICQTNNDDDPDHPGKNFSLEITNGKCCNPNLPNNCNTTFLPIAEDSTCDPFSLEFGPFKLESSDLNCSACYNVMEGPPGAPASGQYYIRITEAA